MSKKVAKPVFALALALALALAGTASAAARKPQPSCPAGQVQARGACIAACPAQGTFASPVDCECPAGYGKILLGNGGGQCQRLTCPMGVAVDPALCACPAQTTMKAVRKGQGKCVPQAATAKAK